MTHYSNCFYSTHQEMESHKKYEKLIEKIDSQTEFIRQGFQEMNQNFKLPKISNQNEQN